MPGLIDPELLALFDRDERYAAHPPDVRREELPYLVRHVDNLSRSSAVVYSRLDESNVDDAIDNEMAYFASLGHDFEWKAYTHDQPTDLLRRLGANGFVIGEREAVLVLDLEGSQHDWIEHTPSVTRIDDPRELSAITEIRRRVYGDVDSHHADRLAWEVAHGPPGYVSVYVAYADSVPAACGWIRFPERSAFAGLWGGSTAPELRGRGLYTALVAARLREARGRGVRYVTVDASPMSRPILEHRGFGVLTYTTPCTRSYPA